MNIAYLIIAHNNFNHLDRLVKSINGDSVSIFIHIDKKVREFLSFEGYTNIHIIDNRVSVNWGGFSIVEATIELLKTARSELDYDRYVLLSGADYPIRGNEYIIEFFKNNKDTNYINVCKMPEMNKRFERVDYYFIEGGQRNSSTKGFMIKSFNKFVKILNIKRKYPFNFRHYELYAGSQWWAFNGKFINYLLGFIKENPEFIQFYRNTYIPDEMFFQTIIMNSQYKESIKGSLTYADWKIGEPPYPSMIDKRHFPIFKDGIIDSAYGENEILFARKFNDDSGKVVDEIIKNFHRNTDVISSK